MFQVIILRKTKGNWAIRLSTDELLQERIGVGADFLGCALGDNLLISAGLLTEEGVHELSEKISAEIAEAMAFGRKSPFPRGLADFVYSIQP